MPTITPEFLLNLIKRDAGVKKLKENVKDVGRGVARTPGNISGSIVDLIRLFAPRSSDVGSSEWINKKIGAPEVKGDAGKIAEIAASFVAPETLAAKIGALGILGGAGRQDLMLTRGLSTQSLVKRLQEPFPNFKQPSLAISRGEGVPAENFPFVGGDESVMLVLDPTKLDPATNPFSHLVNRDLFVIRGNRYGENILPRHRDYSMTEGYAKSTKEQMLSALNLPKLTPGNDPQHELSVALSPVFKSFEAFEKSPRGAANLDRYANLAYNSKDRVREQANELITKIYGDDPNFKYGPNFYKKTEIIKDLKAAPDGTAKHHLYTLLTRMPSEYAELKYRGRMPIDPNYVLGAVMSPDTIPSTALDMLVERGIPAMDFEEFNKYSNTDMLETFKDISDFLRRNK